ncbi:MAG: OmpA family protein [Desulfobacteraceae bacterium]|nr:OmpA family protein [Desulfobacteraceae bacterium]
MPKRHNPGKWIAFTLLAAGALLLCGCGARLPVEPVDKSGNPSEMIAQLGQSIDDAREDQLDVLSPTWFKRAETSQAKAKKGLEQGAALSEILDNIGRGRAELAQAGVVAIRCKDQLDEAIVSRNAARAVNAQQFTSDYADAEEAFLKLTRAMEDSNFESARANRKAVSDRFRALELRAITQEALGEARQLMQRAEEMKVPKIAPQAFADAQGAISQAESFIAGHRYEKEAIQKQADQAKFMTQRALAIGQASEQIKAMTPEAVSLLIESFLSEINTRLEAPDQRNLSFKEQTSAITAGVTELQATAKQVAEKDKLIQSLNARISELEGTSQQAKYDKDRLAAEKKFNQLFVAVQKDFKPDEAEVYKQLDTLVIRLKGIQFPVGKSEVPPESYPLLTKVQKAIRTFGQPEVTIEGHTDNQGTAEKNQALSQERAEAVKQYLVTNGTLSANKIKAEGYGFSRPIAANETPEGRAQNRRIDVIIKPQKK